MSIGYGLITGFKLDYGIEIYKLIKRSILTRNGKISSHLPYPRFISVFIGEIFEGRNVEIPILEDVWSSTTMKPWSANQGWASDRDVPVLPENTLNLIPSDSPYRLKHEEILNKSDTPTNAPTNEVYDCSSSPKAEVQKSWTSDSGATEGNLSLVIRNSPENREAPEFGESHQNPDAGFHLEEETHQDTEILHYEESHVTGIGSPLNTVLVNTSINRSNSEDSVTASYKVLNEEVSSSLHLNSESDDEEELEIPTDGDQETDQGNLGRDNVFVSTTYGELFTGMIQGYKETQVENVFLTSGGDDSGMPKMHQILVNSRVHQSFPK
ncbi:hypothetical protein Hanom_Chr11g00999741 [Helianthus anomalus]